MITKSCLKLSFVFSLALCFYSTQLLGARSSEPTCSTTLFAGAFTCNCYMQGPDPYHLASIYTNMNSDSACSACAEKISPDAVCKLATDTSNRPQ